MLLKFWMINMPIRVFGITVVFLLSWLGVVQAEEAWRLKLEKQLLDQEMCVLSHLTDTSVKQEAGGLSVTGKAHCEDKRSFIVNLAPGKSDFAISVCEPSYC